MDDRAQRCRGSETKAELLASLALRVFERDELLALLESAACQPEGRLQGMARYLLTTEYVQDERGAEALAQLTDAVLAALRRRLEN